MASPTQLSVVAGEAAHCTRCDLYERATQTVFGEGPAPAPLMFVGEQPGDQEDRAGHPFVGPAGRLLDEGLVAAGIDRGTVYVTNAVKHFKWTARGKRRIHERPNAAEVKACTYWLDREVEIVDPDLLVALGATALRPLFTGKATVSALRGAVQESRFGVPTVVTVHPSSIIRIQDPGEREDQFTAFVRDLRLAADTAGELAAH
ncbi:MAG TPA: UdgX family uracil-DNA binding protein [Acidimicrobiales bacterium]|nr:UdgX family uracil-DNA binding protein [Acidimicrobiales bacterium]